MISIKPRVEDYPKLEHDWKWREWKKNFMAQAMVHQTDKVLDPDYPPMTEELMDLFMAHQRFMYNVLVHCLKTAKGIMAVKQHALTQDAQAVYTQLVEEYEHGLLTKNLAEKLQNEVMDWRLDPTQKKGLFNTLTSWRRKILDLEEMDGTPVPDKQKRLWLSTTLRSNDKMTAILNQVQVMEHASVTMGTLHGSTRTGGDKQMKFDQFFDLLIAQAYTMEENVRRRNKESFQQRNTNSPGRGRGRGGRERDGQNRQANNTGTSSSNNNNQGYQGRGGPGRGRGVNNSGRGRGGRGNSNSNNSSWPKNKDGRVIGPSFEIRENMGFDYEEYVKLTPDQKQQLYSICSPSRNDNQSNNNTNTSRNSQNNSSRSSNNNAASQQQTNQGDRGAHVQTTMANAAVQEQSSSEMEMFKMDGHLYRRANMLRIDKDAC